LWVLLRNVSDLKHNWINIDLEQELMFDLRTGLK
jgi:hypothetical protein